MGRELEDIHGQEASLLLDVVQQLSMTHDLAQIGAIVKRAAGELLAPEGVTFALREQDSCVFADEEAIAPLWKGRRFSTSDCLSGWAMIHRRTAVIEDVDADPRAASLDLYSGTFVKSLVIVPIRPADPLGAIGAYWANPRRPQRREVALLEALAAGAATAIANAELYRQLQEARRHHRRREGRPERRALVRSRDPRRAARGRSSPSIARHPANLERRLPPFHLGAAEGAGPARSIIFMNGGILREPIVFCMASW